MLITNGRLVTWSGSGPSGEIIEDGALLVQDGVIRKVGRSADLEAHYPDEERSAGRPLKTSPALEVAASRLREQVPRLEDDRYMAPDIAAAADLVPTLGPLAE